MTNNPYHSIMYGIILKIRSQEIKTLTRLFLAFIALKILFVLPAGTAYGSSGEDPKAFVICERIKRQSICEEYRLSSLSAADRQLITKHCTTGARCPDENRIGRCVRYTDPDGLVFDKHYYRGSGKKHDWDATTIEETCIQSGGKYEDG
ncbi:MAG: hypothetical protein H6936_03025 [Burkholderiales bacterium]|nr:hypothetical protein [Nitrosomonas sp.]MCP5273827.1 hypothetical protein [Burkholderiales bacterium]